VKAADRLGVDEYFPRALEGARFETWVIGPTRLAELLERGRIDPLLPWRHG
jgi:hypothetical protein